MKILVSMVAFVLAQKITAEQSNKMSFYDIQTFVNAFYDRVLAYAKFLKQPLTLGMFVPTDEKGKVLQEPERKNYLVGFDEQHCDYDDEELRIYCEAKEKVLFKGFSLDVKEISNGRKLTYLQHSEHNIMNVENLKFYIVENVTEWEEGFEFELTESAKKQIGL